VYASASGRIVWAIDNDSNVFVREGIFPDFRQGVDWVLGDHDYFLATLSLGNDTNCCVSMSVEEIFVALFVS